MTSERRPPARAADFDSVQSWLFERVTAPALAGATLARPAREDDARWIRSDRVSASERIDVYRNGYFARLCECLADDYPALAHALGPQGFRALCLDFIDAHPPTSPSLNFYGAPFAAFCATRRAPFAACASELARLEWAVVEAIHADAGAVLDPATLLALAEPDWARARLVPSPALRVLHAAYPVLRHHRAFLEGLSPSLPDLEPSVVAVCRRGDDVWRLDVARPFAALLADLIAGVPLARALAALEPPDFSDGGTSPADLQRVLSEWVACGFFAAVALD
jgi:hypothetical protein